MEELRRRRRWAVAALGLLAVSVALGLLAASCAGVGGEEAERRSPGSRRHQVSDEQVAAVVAGRDASEPGSRPTSTSAADGPASGGRTSGPADDGGDGGDGRSEPGPSRVGSGGGAVVPLGAADCAALAQVVIPAAAIITEDDFVPLDQRPSAQEPADRVAALARIAEIAPAETRTAWRYLTAQSAEAAQQGAGVSPQDLQLFRDTRNDTEWWAHEACPDAPPSWECDVFGSMSGPDVAPSVAEADTPEAVLRRFPDTRRAVVLQRTGETVLYGWVNPPGFVTRTVQIERVGDGWATARRHVCQRYR